MRKNIFSAFRNAVVSVVARNPRMAKRVIGGAFAAGDALVLTIPAVKSGFVRSLVDLAPDMGLLAAAYGERALPVVISGLFIAGGISIARDQLVRGFGLGGIGTALLIGDAVMHGEIATAWTMVPNALGACIGVGYKSLRERFGKCQKEILRKTLGEPLSLSGMVQCLSAFVLLGSSLWDRNPPLFASAVCWSTGSLLMAVLPSSDVPPPRRRPPGLHRKGHPHRRVREKRRRHVQKNLPAKKYGTKSSLVCAS